MEEALLNIVLFQPEIPQNTGNVGRLCAFAGLRLHLIHPLGFQISDRHLKRSGMDYWHELNPREHADWQAFKQVENHEHRSWMLTTRGSVCHWDGDFQPGDYLIFGSESSGLPSFFHEEYPEERKLRIPSRASHLRSLNLSTSVGIVAYEALKKIRNDVGFSVF